jgi:hypothetical protein
VLEVWFLFEEKWQKGKTEGGRKEENMKTNK